MEGTENVLIQRAFGNIVCISIVNRSQDQTQQQIDFTNAHLAYMAKVLLINPYLALLVLSMKSPLEETNCTSCGG